MNLDIDRLIRRSDYLFSTPERYNSETMWAEITEFMLNNQTTNNYKTAIFSGDVFSSLTASSAAPGSKKTRRLYDSTALQCVQDLASAFQGTLTNPVTIWSRLRYKDEVLNNSEEANIWLDKSNIVMHNMFNESNFNTEIAKAYQSYVSIANMAMLHEETYDENTGLFSGFNFTALHMSRIAWTENRFGIVDTIFRKFELTARQAFNRWGEEVHDGILKCLEQEPDKSFSFLHCIFPRDRSNIILDELGLAPGSKRPIASIYIDISNKKIVEDSGYYEMPVYASRYGLAPGEVYGRGPGHLSLPDVRTLNQLKMRGLEAIDLQVRPPLFANQRDVFGQLNLRPGGVSIVKSHAGIREFISQARNDILNFNVEDLRNSIRSIFHLDKLLLPPRTETGEMTAYEVSQRIEQMQRVLGPTLSRLNNEFLNPLIIRSFKILLRAGALPEVPQIVRDRGIDIEISFVNQLARAQQIQDVTTIQQWIQGLAGIAQFNPAVLDLINVDGIAKHTAKVLGVPEEAVQNEDTVTAIRQQRAQAQQQASQLESMVKGADVASKLNMSAA